MAGSPARQPRWGVVSVGGSWASCPQFLAQIYKAGVGTKPDNQFHTRSIHNLLSSDAWAVNSELFCSNPPSRPGKGDRHPLDASNSQPRA